MLRIAGLANENIQTGKAKCHFAFLDPSQLIEPVSTNDALLMRNAIDLKVEPISSNDGL
jgi:hypothetical protein